jgi:hypothetical protein
MYRDLYNRQNGFGFTVRLVIDENTERIETPRLPQADFSSMMRDHTVIRRQN